jgi:hypothetical protein
LKEDNIMRNLNTIFYDRMNEYIQKRNISEDELFEKAKFSDKQIESIKNGELGALDAIEAFRIGYILNVSMDYLTGTSDLPEETALEELHRQTSYALLLADDSQDEADVLGKAFVGTLQDMIENERFTKEEAMQLHDLLKQSLETKN